MHILYNYFFIPFFIIEKSAMITTTDIAINDNIIPTEINVFINPPIPMTNMSAYSY